MKPQEKRNKDKTRVKKKGRIKSDIKTKSIKEKRQ
jgi:hypothetical protein